MYNGKFCIVFNDRKEYRTVSDLNTGAEENRDGLYYYGSPKVNPPITIVHQVNEWGVMFAVTDDLSVAGRNVFYLS